jgi:hypothetical protein
LLAHGRWLSPGTPVSSTTKTGRQGMAEILLKVALSTTNLKKSIKFNKCVLVSLYQIYVKQFSLGTFC